MTLAAFHVPTVGNEPNKHYAKDSPDRKGLAAAVAALQKRAPIEVPVTVAGKSVCAFGRKTWCTHSD